MTNRRNFLIAIPSLAIATTVLSRLPAFADGVRSGTFTGASNHVTRGTGAVGLSQSGQAVVTLQSDFWFDGAPDPKVALGRDGYDASTIMGALRSNSGQQSYAVPAGLSLDDYNEIWIWCERFNVPLGVAKLN